LATATEIKTVAGDKGLSKTTTEFEQRLRNDGYAPSTVKGCSGFLTRLENRGVDIFKPEHVKQFIAEQKWTNHSKATMITYYDIFAKTMHLLWDPPRYRYEQKIPWIPLEKEIDDLVAGCGKKTATFLRLLKETGLRFGEALRLEWTDVDVEKSSVVTNNPEKGSRPRILPISQTLKAMLNSLPRKQKKIFPATKNTISCNFRKQRNAVSVKLKNPRLNQITFHTLRHYFATMLYAKTLNLLKVQQALGHRNINNTMIYVQLVDFKSEDYDVQVAENVEEAKKLGEAGFEHYDTIGSSHLYRKRK
jgi:integrase